MIRPRACWGAACDLLGMSVVYPAGGTVTISKKSPLIRILSKRTDCIDCGDFVNGRGKGPLVKGGCPRSGLGDFDGLCRISRHTRRRPGIPPPRLRSAPPFDKGGFDGPYVTARKRSPPSLSQNFTNFTRSTQNLPSLCKTFTAIVPYYGRNRRKTAVQLACFR